MADEPLDPEPEGADEPAPELRPWSGSVRAASMAASFVQARPEPEQAPETALPRDVTTAPIVEPLPEAPFEPAAGPVLGFDPRRLGYLVLGLVALFLVSPLFAALHGAFGFRIEVYGSTAAFFGLVVAAILTVLPLLDTLPRRMLYGAVAVALVVSLLGNVLGVPVVSDLSKLAFAACAGVAMLTAVERSWWLLPVCVFVPVADAWSVFSSRGVTNKIVEQSKHNSAWLDWPTIVTPTLGYDYDVSPRIGIVDIFFCTLLLGAAVRWGIPVLRVAGVFVVGFVLSTLLAIEVVPDGVPALPLLCLGFLVVGWRVLITDLRAEITDARTSSD